MAQFEKDKQTYNQQSHGCTQLVPTTQSFAPGQQRSFFQQKGKNNYKGNFQQQPQQVRWQQQQFSAPNQASFQQQQPQQPPLQQQQQPRPLMQQQQQQPQPLLQQQQLNFAPSRQQQQFDAGFTSNQGQINAVSQQRVFTSPDSSVARAPTNFEFQSENKQVVVCLRCRVLSDHRGPNCPYFKFCSYCAREGHSDYEHKNGLIKLDAGQQQPQQLPQQPPRQLPQQLPQQQTPAQQPSH